MGEVLRPIEGVDIDRLSLLSECRRECLQWASLTLYAWDDCLLHMLV